MSERLFSGRLGYVAAGLLVGEFTSATQSLVVTTIMPKIAADLHGLPLYAYAYAALYGASLLTMPFAGPFADRFGTRRTLALGYVLVLAGLIASMLSRAMPQFLVARAAEGAGGGLDYAVSLAAIAKVFPENLRPRMFAWSSAMWVVPGLVGPALGAFVATAFGWRFAFGGFIPLVLLSAALVLPALSGMTTVRSDLDAFGAFRALVAIRSLTLPAFALLQGAFFGADAYVSLMLTAVRGASLTTAGLCITVAVLGWSVGSTLQPRLLQLIGIRAVVATSALAGIGAAVGLAAVDLGAPLWIAFAAWILGGYGIGSGYSALTLEALSESNEGREGTTSSATLIAGVAGSTLGIVLCGVPVTLAHRGLFDLRAALSISYGIAAAGAVLLFLLSTRIPQRSKTAS